MRKLRRVDGKSTIFGDMPWFFFGNTEHLTKPANRTHKYPFARTFWPGEDSFLELAQRASKRSFPVEISRPHK